MITEHRKDGNAAQSWKWRNNWGAGLCTRRFAGWGGAGKGRPCAVWPEGCEGCVRYSGYRSK